MQKATFVCNDITTIEECLTFLNRFKRNFSISFKKTVVSKVINVTIGEYDLIIPKKVTEELENEIVSNFSVKSDFFIEGLKANIWFTKTKKHKGTFAVLSIYGNDARVNRLLASVYKRMNITPITNFKNETAK